MHSLPEVPRSHHASGWDDSCLFHTLELVGMFASYRVLLSKLGNARISHSYSGILAMLAAVCGIYVNWRKVCKKKAGTKHFKTAIERRRSEPNLADKIA